MEERENPLRKIKVIVRPSPRLLKIVVVLLIIFTTAATVALSWVRAGIDKRSEEIRQEAAEMEQENADLEEKIGEVGSVQSVQDIAEEELGLANPDTVVINPNSD